MEFKHELILTNRFVRDIKHLDENIKKRLEEKLVEIANNPYKGEELRGSLRGKYRVRIGKYRLIYSIPEYCKVVAECFRQREVAYKP